MDQVLRSFRQGVLLTLHVVPRAAKNEIVGMYGGALKVRLRAPPAKGAANAALVELIAREFGVPKQKVQIISGETSRRKRLAIHGVSQQAIRSRLTHLLPDPAAGL
jgi:uncharacterized protein (TIGR00251 family)